MNGEERMKIADALKPVIYNDNEYVVREGEKGDYFFIIEEGNASATKSLN